MPFGTTVIASGGTDTMASTDGMPVYETGGVTLDWTNALVAGAGGLYLPGGEYVPANVAYFPFGLAMLQTTTAEVQTLTVSGSPTGGSFTLKLDNYTTTALPYNATAAAVQSALAALPNVGVGNVTVTLSGSTYTVTFAPTMGNVPTLVVTSSLTGGTSPAIAVATTTSGVDGGGKFAPWDGTTTLVRGQSVILNKTIQRNSRNWENPPGAIVGGPVYRQRIKALVGGAYVPTWNATLEAAFPLLHPVDI